VPVLVAELPSEVAAVEPTSNIGGTLLRARPGFLLRGRYPLRSGSVVLGLLHRVHSLCEFQEVILSSCSVHPLLRRMGEGEEFQTYPGRVEVFCQLVHPVQQVVAAAEEVAVPVREI
jgi:hypothetical protein